MEASDIYSMSEHTNIFSGILPVQGADCLISKECFLWNAVALTHVVDRDTQIDSFVHEHKLAARDLINKAGPV